MGEWRETTLSSVVTSNNQSIDKNYEYKTIQYLDTGSITNGKIEGYQEITISEAPSRAKRLVKHKDIIYSTVRPIQRHFGFIQNPIENLVVSTGDEVENGVKELLSDDELLEKMKEISSRVVGLKQYMTETKTPVCVITVDKRKSQLKLIKKLKVLKKYIKMLVIVDQVNNDLTDAYMLIWRVVNNIDAGRDIILTPFIAIDATNKSEVDGYEREWPGDTFCTKEVLDMLQEKGLIDIDEAFIRKFGLLPF